MAPKAKAKAKTAAEAPKVFPPPASSSGKRYYVHHLSHQTGGRLPFVAVGSEVALHFLGGSWIGKGAAPKGFTDLEDACNDLLSKCPNNIIILMLEVPVEAAPGEGAAAESSAATAAADGS